MFDITRLVSEELPAYTPEERFTREALCTVERDRYNLTRFTMSAHCGTHMDAPAHFIAGGKTIDQIPLELLAGPALVFTVGENEDFAAVPQGTPRLIMRGCKGLTAPQAETLVRKGVRLIGTDEISVGPADNEMQIHLILLGNDAWILENVCLDGVPDGDYELICLPMKLQGVEGAPARALLRRV